MTSRVFCVPLPEVDQWGIPKEKMPHCPGCGEDELGLLEPDRAICYRCSASIVRYQDGISIIDVEVVCCNCPWMGTVLAMEPDHDGDLCCPQCFQLIEVRADIGD